MAENNEKSNNGDKREYRAPPRATFDIAEFYNYGTEGGSRLKIVMWSDRVGFIFSSWDPVTKVRSEEKVWFSPELMIILENILKEVVIARHDQWKKKQDYAEINFPLDNVYLDKEQNAHTNGRLFIRTAAVKEGDKNVNRVQLAWTSSKGNYQITLGNKLMPLIVGSSPDIIAKVDPIDTAFFRFVLTLSKISSSMVHYAIGAKLAEMMMNSHGGGGEQQNQGGRREWNNNRGSGGNQGGENRSGGNKSFRTNTQDNDADINF